MEEELRFEETQEKIENPNPENNIFSPYCDTDMAGLTYVILGVCLIVLGIYDELTNLDNPRYIIILLIFVAFGTYIIRYCGRDLFPKYVLIPNARTMGNAYPGVVIGEQAKVAAVFGSGSLGSHFGGRRTFYSIDIRYWKKITYTNGEVSEQPETIHIYGYHVKPSMCLENPYCTVYEYGNMKFAVDFKVRDKFVNQEGKLIDENGRLNDDFWRFPLYERRNK